MMLQVTGLVAGNSLKDLLRSASLYLEAYFDRFSQYDLIRGGHFQWDLPPLHSLNVWNANNHQTTYEILRFSIAAIFNYMANNGWGTATFTIVDGENQVGMGEIK